MLFPIGVITGLIVGWGDELKGGVLAVGSTAAFYFVWGFILSGSIRQGWWFAIFTIPGVLFLLYGIISLVSRAQYQQPTTEDKFGPLIR